MMSEKCDDRCGLLSGGGSLSFCPRQRGRDDMTAVLLRRRRTARELSSPRNRCNILPTPIARPHAYSPPPPPSAMNSIGHELAQLSRQPAPPACEGLAAADEGLERERERERERD
eukprot:GHVU01023988.1.p2 GENE.GHVU01023988.1~~GHVU01023988.1.p2  ORF type:complete len:115 (+),score=12.64 GHVU01023988.1:1011-1355(+)